MEIAGDFKDSSDGSRVACLLYREFYLSRPTRSVEPSREEAIFMVPVWSWRPAVVHVFRRER
jgi:hypothetical protein